MWPFSNQVQYVAAGGCPAPAMGTDSSGLGGTPIYVAPPATPPPPPTGAGGGTTPPITPAALPSITVDIACPAFASTGSSLADGGTIAVLAPPGATQYRVWFSPA